MSTRECMADTSEALEGFGEGSKRGEERSSIPETLLWAMRSAIGYYQHFPADRKP